VAGCQLGPCGGRRRRPWRGRVWRQRGGDAGERGLVGPDAVGLHPGEDVEAAAGGVGVGGGGVGAEVEEAVVVVEGERNGGGGGEGVVVEAERGGEVGVAGAHVELVAEEAFGRAAGAAAAGCLAFVSLASVLRRRVGDRGGGGVAASAGEGKVFDGAAEGAARGRQRRRGEEGGGRGAEGRRGDPHSLPFLFQLDWVRLGLARVYPSSSLCSVYLSLLHSAPPQGLKNWYATSHGYNRLSQKPVKTLSEFKFHI
jgi:hypothetical protein